MNARRWATLAAVTVVSAGMTFFLYNFAQFGDCRVNDLRCETGRMRDARVMLALCTGAYIFSVVRLVGRWKGR